MIHILTPCEESRRIPDEVLAGIALQNVECKHHIFRSPGWNGKDIEDKYRCEAVNRIQAQEFCRTIEDDIVVLMDSDVQLLIPQALSLLLMHLEGHPMCGYVALWFKKVPKITTRLPHVDIKCCAIRKHLFESVNYQTDKLDCLCNITKNNIEQHGYYAEYLSFNKYAKELEKGENHD